ncbi:MAG: hypothetical protein AB2A00_34910 [Myxococcota bacterium]
MVSVLHEALDNLALVLADRTQLLPMQWVPPPEIDTRLPLGEVLPEPNRMGVVWPKRACTIDVVAPTTFLPSPNDRLRLRWWPTSEEQRRGTLVIAPPWKVTSFTGFLPLVRALNRMGLDVVGYPTPYHFERTPPGALSGELFATWDMPRTGWAIRAAALELCALVESLQPRGPVVLLGTSLGGFLSAMMSVVAPFYPRRAFQVSRMVLVVPPASFLDTFAKTAIGERYRRLLSLAGGTVPEYSYLEQLAVPFSPGMFPSVVAGENILIVAGKHDKMVPVESSQALAEGLKARFRIYDVGHVSGLCFSFRLWMDVLSFLEEMPLAQARAEEHQERAHDGVTVR